MARQKAKRVKKEGFSWIRLAAGLAAGTAGVLALTGDPHWIWGLPLQALSAWLLITAWPAKAPVDAPLKPVPAPKASKKKSKAPASDLWLLLPLVAALGARFFFSMNQVKVGLILVGLSLAALLLLRLKGWAGLPLDESGPEAGEKRLDRLALAFLMGVVILMRFPFLGQNFTGLQIDEANDLLDGINVMNGTLKTPFGVGWWANPSLPYFVLAGFFKVFGVHLAVARGLSALLGCATIFFFYRFCRFFFSVGASLAAGLFFNLSWWFLFYSLSPFDDIFTVSFAMAAFYFTEKALREGRRVDFAWAGFWAGAGVMTYISGRLIPVMVAAALGGIFLFLRPANFLRRFGPYLVLSGLFLLWILGPFILFMVHNPDEFFGRSRELSVFNQVHLTGNVFLPAIYFFWSLVSLFHASPEVDPRFNLPGNCELDPFTGFLVLVGLEALIVSAFRFKGRFFWYAASGVFFGIVANAFAVQGSTPNPGYTNDQRFFIVLPFLMMVLAAGLDWLKGRLSRAPQAFRRVALALLVLLLAGAAAVNGKVYYWSFQNSPGIWSSLGFNHMKAAEAALAYSPRCHLLVHAVSDSSVFEFLTYGKAPFAQYHGVPIDNQVTKDVAVVFSPWDWTGWGEILQAYPHATVTDFKNPWNEPAVKVIEIPLADIQASQKKLKTLGPALP